MAAKEPVRLRPCSAFLAACLGMAMAVSFLPSAGANDFDAEIRPLLAKYCFECHGAEKQKGDIRLDTLDPNLATGADAETWSDVLDQINLGDMPPKKAAQPNAANRKQIATWLTAALREAVAAQRFAAGRVAMRRLTRYEYANTMRDLLHIEHVDLAAELPPEPLSPQGFLNDGATLEMSPTQIETYLAAARRALSVAIVTGDPIEAHVYTANKTATGNLPNKREGGQLPANPEFLLDVPKYARTGPFRLEVTAKASIPAGAAFPRMRVSLGHVPGIIHIPRKMVAEVELSSDQSQTFVFHGRMEDYPQAGDVPFQNLSFHGMIVMLDFLDAEGNELRYPDRQYVQLPPKPKKGEKPKAKPAPVAFGTRLDIAAEKVAFTSPWFASWPPESHRFLFEKDDPAEDEAVRARSLLTRFLPRAFRRPAAAAEIDPYSQLFDRLRPKSESFEATMREVLAAVLVSPHFLYIVETRGPEDKQAQPLSGYELANRLSYFLWSSMPDETLLTLAETKKLHQPAILQREVQRMLEDERSREFVSHFTEQWFDLGALDRVAVNPEFYPGFDNDLKDDMRRETLAFFEEILRADRSCLEFIDSDWTMANRALATHYGIQPAPRSFEFTKVALKPELQRGGLLGQGSFLLSQSNGESSHPIKRAVWILDRLLGTPPAPPPPAVPELDTKSAELAGLSLKAQLEHHRQQESCRNCHEDIDPWGIPLENFDAIGLWRETAPVRIGAKGAPRPAPIALDSRAKLPDGTALTSANALRTYLLEERREAFARSTVERLMGYALGRSLDFGDRETIDTLTRTFIAQDFRLRGLIVALATSPAFQTK